MPDELEVVLDRFRRFERELLTTPLFDDRPAAEQSRLRREYQEHLEKLDTARRRAADPRAAALEREIRMNPALGDQLVERRMRQLRQLVEGSPGKR